MSEQKQKSIYKYSSELGPGMGLYLFLMSACLLISVHWRGAVLPLLPLALGWPVMMWFLLKRIWNKCPHYRTTSAMWLAGIWICIFGALICAALSSAWILIFQPDFISLYLHQCLDMVQAADLPAAYTHMTADMRTALESGNIPSPMQWIFSMIWFTAFSGAIMSLIVAICMTARKSSHSHKFP